MSIYDRLHALAQGIDADVEQRKASANAAAQQQIRVPIAGGVGTVTVTGAGQLVSVDLDRRRLGNTNGTALGRDVIQAIKAAEYHAAVTVQTASTATDRR